MNEVVHTVGRDRFDMNEYLAKTVLEQLPFAVLLANLHGEVCYTNESGKNFLAYTEEELYGLYVEEIILSAEQVKNTRQLDSIPTIVREKASVMDNLAFCRRKNGDVLLVDVKIKSMNLWNGPYVLYAFTDMTPYRQECESVTSQAHTDSLTNAYNRRGFDVYLKHELERYTRAGSSMALMFIDIDDFKHINDRYGHYYGDEVLVVLTSIIKTTCRGIDIVCRYGGDELAVLLPGATSEIAYKIANRVLQQVSLHDWDKACITSSIGLTALETDEYRDHDIPFLARSMMTCADLAMYESKHSGKNCASCKVFSEQELK